MVDAVHAQSVVDDGVEIRLRPHLTGADRVVDRGRVFHDDASPVGVGSELELRAGRQRFVQNVRSDVLHGVRFH